MLAHTASLEMYDQTARVVAVDFTTRRVLVTWGSGIESWTSGFEYHDGGYLRCSAPYQPSCTLDGAAFIDARYSFHTAHWSDGCAMPPASTEEHGTRSRCQRFASGRLHRFRASQSWGHHFRGRKLVSNGDLGPCDDELIVSPVVPIRRSAEDSRVELSDLAEWLQARGVPAHVWAERCRLQAVGAWLLAMRAKLMHGFELHELAAEHHATPLNSSALDSVIVPLVKARVVRPYSFAPGYASDLGLRTHAGDELKSARSFALAVAGEMRAAKMHRGEDYTDEEWRSLCASLGVVKLSHEKTSHYGGATGSLFWYFALGKASKTLPDFIL